MGWVSFDAGCSDGFWGAASVSGSVGGSTDASGAILIGGGGNGTGMPFGNALGT